MAMLRHFLHRAWEVIGFQDAKLSCVFTSPVGIRQGSSPLIPPYYDNIGYADLSDFFYVWLRRSLHSRSFLTSSPHLLCPKPRSWSPLLTVTAVRNGQRRSFLDGMTEAMQRLADQSQPWLPCHHLLRLQAVGEEGSNMGYR